MKPCIRCGRAFVSTTCPGHITPTGIEDHCGECADGGYCSAIEAEKDKLAGGEIDACCGRDPMLQGYPLKT